jgi:hypothetical protein
MAGIWNVPSAIMTHTTNLLSANVGMGDFGSSTRRSADPIVGGLLSEWVAEVRDSKDKTNGFGIFFIRIFSGIGEVAAVLVLVQST